jgi:hypothetical protein
MSKQHLADMLKSMTTGDEEGAKTAFSMYAAAKSQEILSRGEEPQAEAPTGNEPPSEPTDVTPPTDEDTTE